MRLELPGPWSVAPANDALLREFAEPDHDDSAWTPIAVPGHWQSNPTLAAEDGPVLYRTRFETPRPDEGTRAWLRFDGIFYQGDVFLDGAYVGDTEGYFAPHEFEVTELLRATEEHVLAVEVGCAPQRNRTAKRNITGVFQHWSDGADPATNPGGIWRPVAIERTGAVRISALRTRCLVADDDRAVVQFRAELDSLDGREVTIRTNVGRTEHGEEHSLASGHNVVEWRVTIDRPRLWWPRALGEPTLQDVTVEVAVDGVASDNRSFRTGLRTVSMKNWICQVNGERLFLKGANQGPPTMLLAEADEATCRRPVELAVDAGLDFLRLHGHIGRPETYEAADEAGILLWQDFPLQWGYTRQIRKQAVRQAGQMVDLLGHHPSLAIWCGHNEPFGLEIEPGAFADEDHIAKQGRRYVAQQQLPTWNKTVLDRSVKRAIDKADGTRPVIAHSGVLPHLPALEGTDSHLWFGWMWGNERDLPSAARTLPRLFRFVSEFGSQAVPDNDDFVDASLWPNLDWDLLTESHGLHRALLERRAPTAEHASYEGWKTATQTYQATLVKHHVETLRRLKYKPTGGFAVYCLIDGHPVISRSLVDHAGAPKAAFAALTAASAPVIVVAERLPEYVMAGDPIALDIHVVSDRRTDHAGAVDVTLGWDGGTHAWHFAGEVPADSCVRVGTIQFEVPDAHGTLRLVLSGSVGSDVLANEYTTEIGE